MKERPILFSAPMVRAILSGNKTQTRRVVKMKRHHTIEERDDGTKWPWMHDGERDADWWMPCPYGQRLDRLWVRETWYCDDYRVQRGPYLKPDDMDIADAQSDGTLVYRASSGDRPYEAEQPVWRPSIHMPRWASRITLEITNVRVERLQDISPSDCEAEGVHRLPLQEGALNPWYTGDVDSGLELHSRSTIGAYHKLWEKINGAGSWEANPWVWVVEFKRLEGGAA